MVKVVFVCLGNICRSPMAEGLFRKEVANAGLTDEIEIDSAATGTWNLGKPPHRGTREVLKKHGINYEAMRARKVTDADFEQADYIIGMDQNNIADLNALNKNKDVTLRSLMSFVSGKEEEEIPDPYYTGDFDETERMVTEGVKALLAFITKK
ncbi:low molecular weight phosphotyrosine protein phosphatase [Listeria innocua]|uniref:protein-tyrosine-phosphatase n=1 Tax=Listeria innocua serovar 6a (strain ATCC BAA-680 / CLIP 11262) TaxID=272626 RepID=Q92D81_LISIN|nr:low molecular weight protein-tyrosine-phosphatase [Listeria innocua]EAD5709426.1 low molecular weight phosphotyrosine protein phosphatase [Listeria innocua]EAE2481495.1 low molecular weight phosphotyrosine protein phosphatase [Listeria innocua]EAF5009727.1 low molecular weight phosphotyrosine protein phosphatase [Listeria innocua]EAG8523725.1 low molecular weight phosphotyrosine protein phosphatase [Listeria innocua]EBB6229024.1 low molecular weight phosphotyrosine protein phosphatase [List